jgi:regulatory protein
MPALKQKTPAEALTSLMRLASRAEKSSGDARRLMRGWGLATADAEKVLAQLTAQKFIDDRRYAAAYTREKLRASGWGAHKIAAALRAKGISREIVTEALETHLEPEAQGERLATRLARKLPSIKGDNPYEKRSKLIRYGLSLGYDYDTVTDEVDKIFKHND